MIWLLTVALLLHLASWPVGNAEISSGRIKGDDEPHMVSWRVLEGVTEPFESNLQESIPAWKQMKNGADQKAAGLFIQQALHEYGQLLRHPYMFGEMPMEDRYDVFLSMSKLLKTMGFHQRAELLLYEAMSYTTNPHEAHLQLGLLFLDKEDLEKAKIHLKNCLFFKENDVHILIHLSVILIAEGRIHEAKFFLSRILSGLEARVHTLSFMLSPKDIHALTTDRVEYKTLSTWVEDLIVKVFYGEFRFTPSATMDMLKLFSNLYRWISEGELVGRFIFDLGQSLYEGGRPKIGQMMMKRGFETSDAEVEGAVSTAIVDMRLALDYPVVPDTQVEILEAYVNMTSYLSTTSSTYVAIDVENVVDLYWPLPLLPWSALPMMPVVKEVLWRFEGGPVRTDVHSLYWYNETTYDEIVELYHPQKEVVSRGRYLQSAGSGNSGGAGSASSSAGGASTTSSSSGGGGGIDKEKHVLRFDVLQPKHKTTSNGIQTIVIPPTSPTTTTPTKSNKRAKSTSSSTSLTTSKIKVEVGIFGGHMNNHPVGHMVFRRILALLQPPINPTYANPNTHTSGAIDWRDVINLTLLALPLVPDTTTKRIANSVTRIVNLPMDTNAAWRIIQTLHLDVIFFPDWQPFPDQQSTLFMSRRMAPVQVCFYVRGSSCSSVAVDYYLLPMEMEEMYYKSTPASAVDAKVTVSTSSGTGSASTTTTSSSGSTGVRPNIPQEGSFDPSQTNTNNTTKQRLVQRSLRPQWREFYSEQVVLLDWPVMTTRVIQAVASSVASSISTSGTNSASGGSTGASGNNGSGGNRGSGTNSGTTSANTHNALDSLMFAPLETEGRIFFENQPVAVLPVHPAYLHPLMDDVVFKIMRSVPALHVVIALPEMYFTHVRDSKHKISWARKLVRRLWTRGGSLFHRIRLLPAPLSDHRMLQLLRQADMVLDSFPIGNPFQLLSLATSVGTPVVTLRPGTSFSTSKDALREMRTYITTQRAKHRALSNSNNNNNNNNNNSSNALTNPMAQHVMMFDLPYMPASSSISGYYDRIGLGAYFVANSTAGYFELAESLATNREFAYSLRVRLLEAVDDQKHHHTTANPSTTAAGTNSNTDAASTGLDTTASTSVSGGSTMEEWEETEESTADDNNTSNNGDSSPGSDADGSIAGGTSAGSAGYSGGEVVHDSDDCGHCVDDLGRFILSVGVPYARSRSWRAQSILQQRSSSGGSASSSGATKSAGNAGKGGGVGSTGAQSRRARRSVASASRGDTDDANDEFYGAGTIA